MATQPRTPAHVDVITYVVDGDSRPDDTLGSDFVLQHGDVKRRSFGAGAGNVVDRNSGASDFRSVVLSIEARDRTGAPPIDRRSLKRCAIFPSPYLAMPLRRRGRVAAVADAAGLTIFGDAAALA